MSRQQRILITGGFGFIGSQLALRLLAEGHTVRVFDNGWRGHRRRLPSHHPLLETIEADVRDATAIRRACQDVDTVFHLAAVNGTVHFYEQPDLVLDVGVRGTLAVLDAAMDGGVGRLLLASSAETYQQATVVPTAENEPLQIPDVTNPRYSYAGSKLIGELLALHYARRRRMETVIFRPHNIYGPDMGSEHAVPQLIERLGEVSEGFQRRQVELPILGSGKETRTYCYIDDAIEGIMVCWQRGKDGEIYHVGQDAEEEEISGAGLASLIGEVAGIAVTPVPTGERTAQTSRRRPNVAKLRALGYRPRVGLAAGLRRTLEWYRTHALHKANASV